MMTYIELINNFWILDEDWQFTCCETRLYFYLLKTANRLGWVDSWTRSDAKVSSDVGVSVNSMKTARNRLVQAGLMEFKSGGKGQRDKTRYQLSYQNLTPKPQPKLQPNHIPKLQPKVEPNTYKVRALDLDKDKDNNSSPSHMRVGEEFPDESFFDKSLEDCYAELKSNQSWAETVTMNIRSSGYRDFTLEFFYGYLEQFFMEQQNKGETSKSPKDAMSHFASWLKIELKNKKNERKTDKNRVELSTASQSTATISLGQPDWFNKQAGTLEEFIDSLPIGR